jgi:hypothetical protein
MFHDKRIHGKPAAAAPKRQGRQFMFRGVRRINIWQHLPAPELGSAPDDWKVTGEDLRGAMGRFSATYD